MKYDLDILSCGFFNKERYMKKLVKTLHSEGDASPMANKPRSDYIKLVGNEVLPRPKRPEGW
jgi:hypothetical protein